MRPARKSQKKTPHRASPSLDHHLNRRLRRSTPNGRDVVVTYNVGCTEHRQTSSPRCLCGSAWEDNRCSHKTRKRRSVKSNQPESHELARSESARQHQSQVSAEGIESWLTSGKRNSTNWICRTTSSDRRTIKSSSSETTMQIFTTSLPWVSSRLAARDIF